MRSPVLLLGTVAALALLAGVADAADLPCPEGTYPIHRAAGTGPSSIELKRYPGECSVKVGNEWMTVLPGMVKALAGTDFQPGAKGSGQAMGTGGAFDFEAKVLSKEEIDVAGAKVETVKIEATSSRVKDVWTAWYVPATGMVVRYRFVGPYQSSDWQVTKMPAR